MALLLGALPVTAGDTTNSPLLTVKRIFDSGDFGGAGFSARWLEDGSGYMTFESSKETPGGRGEVSSRVKSRVRQFGILHHRVPHHARG